MVEPGFDRSLITGLVLAGGQGSRLGGIDKGLQAVGGQPLVQIALQRLAPQVGRTMVSANRNLEAYRAFGVPVWADSASGAAIEASQGPLAGFLAGLTHCDTPYLLTVPCDCPHFPTDLAQRLAHALAASNADIAVAATRHSDDGGSELLLEPAFCLMKRELQSSLLRFMQSGHRKIEHWTAEQRRAEAVFDDPAAFFNVNTPDDLAQLQRR